MGRRTRRSHHLRIRDAVTVPEEPEVSLRGDVVEFRVNVNVVSPQDHCRALAVGDRVEAVVFMGAGLGGETEAVVFTGAGLGGEAEAVLVEDEVGMDGCACTWCAECLSKPSAP